MKRDLLTLKRTYIQVYTGMTRNTYIYIWNETWSKDIARGSYDNEKKHDDVKRDLYTGIKRITCIYIWNEIWSNDIARGSYDNEKKLDDVKRDLYTGMKRNTCTYIWNETWSNDNAWGGHAWPRVTCRTRQKRLFWKNMEKDLIHTYETETHTYIWKKTWWIDFVAVGDTSNTSNETYVHIWKETCIYIYILDLMKRYRRRAIRVPARCHR